MELHNRTRETIIVIIGLLVVGIGAATLGVSYGLQSKKKCVSVNSTVIKNNAVTEEMVLAALNENRQEDEKFIKSDGEAVSYGTYYSGGPGRGIEYVDKIYYGDLDNDGQGDALLLMGSCGASCGFFLVLCTMMD